MDTEEFGTFNTNNDLDSLKQNSMGEDNGNIRFKDGFQMRGSTEPSPTQIKQQTKWTGTNVYCQPCPYP